MSRRVNQLNSQSMVCESRILLSANDTLLDSNAVNSQTLDAPTPAVDANPDVTVSDSNSLEDTSAPRTSSSPTSSDDAALSRELETVEDSATVPSESSSAPSLQQTPALQQTPSLNETLSSEIEIANATATAGVAFAENLLNLLNQAETVGVPEFFAPGSDTRQQFANATQQTDAAAIELFLLNVGSFQRLNTAFQDDQVTSPEGAAVESTPAELAEVPDDERTGIEDQPPVQTSEPLISPEESDDTNSTVIPRTELDSQLVPETVGSVPEAFVEQAVEFNSESATETLTTPQSINPTSEAIIEEPIADAATSPATSELADAPELISPSLTLPETTPSQTTPSQTTASQTTASETSNDRTDTDLVDVGLPGGELLDAPTPNSDPLAIGNPGLDPVPTGLTSESNVDLAQFQQTANLIGSFNNILINNLSNISGVMQSILDRDFSAGVDEAASTELASLGENLGRFRNISLGGQQLFTGLSQPGTTTFDSAAFADFTSGSIDFEELLFNLGSDASATMPENTLAPENTLDSESTPDPQNTLSELPPLADIAIPFPLDTDGFGEIAGELDESEFEDAFVFDIEDFEQSVVVEAESDAFDTSLAIFNENEDLIFLNDDLVAVDGETVENPLNSRIVANLAPGRYFSTIESFLGDQGGEYRISISANNTGLPASPSSQADLDPDVNVNLESLLDDDPTTLPAVTVDPLIDEDSNALGELA